MKRLSTIIAALLCLSMTALAQGNCTYVPSLDTPQHTLRKLSITFDDYKSVELTNKETAIIYVYRTSLEKKHGNNSTSAMEYYAYSDNMKTSGNTLTFYPEAYTASSGSISQSYNSAHAKVTAWGQDTQDYLRIAIPKGMLKVTDQAGKAVTLDSISYKYEYSSTEVDDNSDPLEYVLTPADGEKVKSLSSVSLEFPNCTGTLVLNWFQTEEPYVINEKGETVEKATRSFETGVKYTGRIALKSSITKPGKYTLVIPAESFYVTTSADGGGDKFYHDEIRATYTVEGEARNWESVPADGSTVAIFDGIHISFPGKTISSKNANVGNGSLKVYDKADDKYPAMEFGYFYAKTEGNTINFTTASQISKVKENTTYYLNLPYGLVTFSDGTQNDGLYMEFTYSTTEPTEPETPGTPDTPDNPDTPSTPNYIVGDNYVGYTTGAVQRKNGVRFNSGSEQGMLIYLPKEKTANLAGCTIKAIRTATGTTQLDSPRLVIIEGDDIDKTPVVEQNTSKFTTSMKDYALDAPYTIKGDKALYVGIKCSLSADYRPMLFDEKLDLPSGLAWALTDNGWQDISNSGYGAPNIQLLLDQNISGPDVLVKPFQTSPYNKAGNGMTISAQILNYGLEEIKSFDLTYKIGDEKEVKKAISDISIPQGSTYDISINDANIANNGRLPLRIEVSNVNGIDDIDPSDNKQSSSTYIYPADMSKKILFEEFTGQGCVNCPAGTNTVNKVLNNYEGQFVEVYHHAGYADDNFTTRNDVEYTWFFGGNTYAPGGMANRHPANPSDISAIVQSNDMGSVQAIVESAMQIPPYVGIIMHNDYDNSTRKGKVSIDVTCYELPSEQKHYINVWLVQDNVKRYQNGSGVINHDNAMRMSLTGNWGNEITLKEGETQTLTFDYTIPETIVGEFACNFLGAEAVEDLDDKNIKALAQDMRIVAFVADNSSDILKCTVWNAEECIVTEENDTTLEPTGIKEVKHEGADSELIYDLQGRLVKSPCKGLYITNGKTILKR